MEEKISIEIPSVDQKSVQPIFSILDKIPDGIPSLPKVISPKIIASRIQEARILAIVKTIDGQSKTIGVIVVETVDETNDFISFSLVFDSSRVSEEMDASIKRIKRYYQSKGLTKITLLLPESDRIIAEIAKKNGFNQEAVLQHQIKKEGCFRNLHLFSAANGIRVVEPLAQTGLALNQNELSDLKEQNQKLSASVQELQEQLKEREEIITNLREQNEKLQNQLKKIPVETARVETIRKEEKRIPLTYKEMRVLETVIKSPQGIKQQDIIRKTKIPQCTVSLAARHLAKIGLVTNKKIGREAVVAPKIQEIAKQFPELAGQIAIPETTPQTTEPKAQIEILVEIPAEPAVRKKKPPAVKPETPTAVKIQPGAETNTSPFRVIEKILKESGDKGISVKFLYERANETGISREAVISVINNMMKQKILKKVFAAKYFEDSIIALKGPDENLVLFY